MVKIEYAVLRNGEIANLTKNNTQSNVPYQIHTERRFSDSSMIRKDDATGWKPRFSAGQNRVTYIFHPGFAGMFDNEPYNLRATGRHSETKPESHAHWHPASNFNPTPDPPRVPRTWASGAASRAENDNLPIPCCIDGDDTFQRPQVVYRSNTSDGRRISRDPPMTAYLCHLPKDTSQEVPPCDLKYIIGTDADIYQQNRNTLCKLCIPCDDGDVQEMGYDDDVCRNLANMPYTPYIEYYEMNAFSYKNMFARLVSFIENVICQSFKTVFIFAGTLFMLFVLLVFINVNTFAMLCVTVTSLLLLLILILQPNNMLIKPLFWWDDNRRYICWS